MPAIEFIVNYFYQISWAILLACFVAFLNHRSNIKSARNIAAAEFRKFFDPTFTFTVYNNFTTDKLGSVFADQKEAARIFEHHVGFINRHSFNKEWNNYEQWVNEILTESKHKAEGSYTLILARNGRSVNEEFKSYIESLLKFAKQT